MTVEFVMNKQFEVLRLEIPDEARRNSREFMKWATVKLAEAMIANGCVKIMKQYDLAHDGVWHTVSVLAGAPPRRLP